MACEKGPNLAVWSQMALWEGPDLAGWRLDAMTTSLSCSLSCEGETDQIDLVSEKLIPITKPITKAKKRH